MEILKFFWANINWFAALISIIGIILNAKKDILCWPTWLFSNFLWIAYSLPKKDYAYVVLWLVFGGFNIYGWLQWQKQKNRKE